MSYLNLQIWVPGQQMNDFFCKKIPDLELEKKTAKITHLITDQQRKIILGIEAEKISWDVFYNYNYKLVIERTILISDGENNLKLAHIVSYTYPLFLKLSNSSIRFPPKKFF